MPLCHMQQLTRGNVSLFPSVKSSIQFRPFPQLTFTVGATFNLSTKFRAPQLTALTSPLSSSTCTWVPCLRKSRTGCQAGAEHWGEASCKGYCAAEQWGKASSSSSSSARAAARLGNTCLQRHRHTSPVWGHHHSCCLQSTRYFGCL